jgi:hypothetical protein
MINIGYPNHDEPQPEKKKNDIDQWRTVVLSAMSYLNFVSQNMDDKTLAVAIEGWLQWSKINIPEECKDMADQAVTEVFNLYTQTCKLKGGLILKHQKRLVHVFRKYL